MTCILDLEALLTGSLVGGEGQTLDWVKPESEAQPNSLQAMGFWVRTLMSLGLISPR